jgi:hypothetical protein
MSGGEIVPSGGAGAAGSVGGDPVAAEITAWEGKMADRASDYWRGPNAEQNQRRYLDLLRQRDNVAAPHDPQAWRATPQEARKQLPAPLVARWEEGGAFAQNLARAQEAVERAVLAIGDPKLADDVARSFDALAPTVQAALFTELSRGVPNFAKAADDKLLAGFSTLPYGAPFLKAWGPQAPRKLGLVIARWNRARDMMRHRDDPSEKDWHSFRRWFDTMKPREQAAVVWTLAGGE